MNDITNRAIEAIGRDEPSSDWILKPLEHAAKLPPEAGALKRILERKEHRTTMGQYAEADRNALSAQARYKRAGRIALGASLAATLVGAIFILPPAQGIPADVRGLATLAEYFLLFVAFLAARYLTFAHPFDLWMKQRATAEIARIRLFNQIMQDGEVARENELPLLPLKLEYFRRYQLEVQRRYYNGRGTQHARAAGHNKAWRSISLALTVAAGCVVVLASLSLLSYLNIELADLLRSIVNFAVWLRADDRWLLAIGVAGSALYGFAAARSLMNLDERNASRYLVTCDNLNYLHATQLDFARKRAAEGNELEVRGFVDRVQSLISSEHQEWVIWREMKPEPDVQAVYMVLPKQ
jgi:hypothetical protein